MTSNWSIKTVLSIIKQLLFLGNRIVSYMDKKQLMDAGEVKQQKKCIEEAINAVHKAIITRRNAHRKFKYNGMPENYKYYREK